MRKRMTSLLLTLVMLLSLVPAMGVTASAAASGNGTAGNPFVVSNYEDWKAAMQQSGEIYIQLGDDIDASGINGGYGLGSADGVRVYGNIHLDLNGKKLTLKKSQLEEGGEICFIRVITGSLTIEDSVNGGEIVGVNKVTKRYMQLIEVQDGTKLTLNSGKLHLEINADTSTPNATIRFVGSVEINGGTVSISKMGEWDEPTAYIYRQNFALEAIEESDNCCALINGGTFDGRVLLAAKASGVADNVITGGDFKKSIYIRKDKAVTGDVPLNVSIQGGTYHYTPGYRTNPADHLYYPGKKNSDPFDLFQFATLGFRDSERYYDDVVYDAFKGGSLYEPDKYDMDAFASMFPKNVIITAEGQEYDHYDQREDEPKHIIVNDAAFTGSSSALDLAHLVNSHYKTIKVTTLPEDALKDMKLTVGSDGTPLPAKGNSTVSGDVTLGSDGTLTKTVYITALGNKQLKEMYYSNPSKIDFGYRLNIFKNGTPVTDYTGDSLTYAALGDEISVSVQLRDFEFEEGVYTFRLALWPYLRGSEAQIGETLVGYWKLTAKEITEISSAHVRLSAALTPGTSAPSAAAVGSGYTVDSINWYTDSNCTESASTFVAGTEYYGKIVLKPETNYKFAASASALFFCDDPNENYVGISSTVAEDGSSLTRVVRGTAVSALVWDSVDTNNQTYTIGDSALTLNAKATGGESGKPITYKLIAKKGGTETVKASAMVAASSTDSFSASLSFTDTGSYECWFEATRGNVTITSDHFTVTVNAPGLSITNQSGDLTVKQGATARLFVKAAGHGVKYQWQDKNDAGNWNDISTSATDYDYSAPTADVGAKTYRCKVTDKYGATKHTDEMTVTVTAAADSSLTPAILLAAVNGDAPDPAVLWPEPEKNVPPNAWLSREAQYNVTAGETFHGVATFSTIPTGFNMNGHDIYSIAGVQKTPVLGDISYKWEGTTKEPWGASGSDFTLLGTDAHASFTIPSGVDPYYVKLSVTNTIGEGYGNQATSTVYITFHVSEAHTHTYAYAQLDATNHTKYCTAGDDSITEKHTLDSNDMCTLCGYAPAKTYSVTVTNGTADHSTDVTPGTKVTLTANHAPTGQEFDKWVGNVAVASDNTFNMPSHHVTVAATYKPIAHTHNYGAWAKLDDNCHYQTCSVAGCDEPTKIEDHTFGNWTKVDDKTHKATCTVCSYEKTENHSWVFDHEDAPTFAAAGTRYYKCSATGCTATKSESIPALTAISAVNVNVTAPVKGATPGTATTADATYDVANTAWDPTVSGTFAGGTEYTVTVSLEAIGNNRFTDKTTFQINGKTAAVVGTKPTAAGADSTKITLEFPATSSGSTGGGGGGGGVTTYAITVKSAKNGDVTASHKTASKGTAVTLTVDPDKGYVLDTLTVLDGKDKEIKLTEKNGKYTFTMPASKVTVEATFKASAPTGKNPFIDVPAGSYYEDAVIWAVDKGITTGTSATTFNPNGICTRAQAVTFLWRAAGSPAAKSGAMPFADVKAGSYYYDAVLWAMEQGITKGTSDTAFSPNASCTRAQIVTFLWRANGSPAVSGNSAFTDVTSDAYYAAAVAWAEKNGVTGGIGNGLFGSGNNCTRAQIVTFLYRAMK